MNAPVASTMRHTATALSELADELGRGDLTERAARLVAARETVVKLIDALFVALPYVTDAEGFPEQFKPGVVRGHVVQIRAALASAMTH